MEFNTFDVAVGIIMFSCILLSTSRGMIDELFDFFGWIIALLLARLSANSVAAIAFPAMQPESMGVLCAFVLVFIVTRIILHLANYALHYFVKTTKLSNVNRLLGGLLGALKGVLFVTLGVFVCAFSDLPKSVEWQTAKSSRFFERNVEILASYMPPFLGSQIQFPPRNLSSYPTDSIQTIPPETEQPNSVSKPKSSSKPTE